MFSYDFHCHLNNFEISPIMCWPLIDPTHFCHTLGWTNTQQDFSCSLKNIAWYLDRIGVSIIQNQWDMKIISQASWITTRNSVRIHSCKDSPQQIVRESKQILLYLIWYIDYESARIQILHLQYICENPCSFLQHVTNFYPCDWSYCYIGIVQLCWDIWMTACGLHQFRDYSTKETNFQLNILRIKCN